MAGENLIPGNHQLDRERVNELAADCVRHLEAAKCCIHEYMEICMNVAMAAAMKHTEDDRHRAADLLRAYADQFDQHLRAPHFVDGGTTRH